MLVLFIHFSSSLFNSALHLRVKLFLHLDYELDIHAACVPDIRFVRINQDYVFLFHYVNKMLDSFIYSKLSMIQLIYAPLQLKIDPVTS